MTILPDDGIHSKDQLFYDIDLPIASFTYTYAA